MTTPAKPQPGELPDLEDAADATGMPPEALTALRGTPEEITTDRDAELRARLEEAATFGRQVREEYDLPELAPTYEEAEARAIANRYVGALRGVRRERAANADELRATQALLERRFDDQDASLSRREDWLLNALRMLAHYFTFGVKKSLRLLAGRVGYRTKPGKWTITESEKLTAWAQEFAPHIVTTPEPKPFVAWKDFTAWADGNPAEAARLKEAGLVKFEDPSEQFYATPED